MNPNAIASSHPAFSVDDPKLRFELEDRSAMTLLRLVLCVALAMGILALASQLLG